MDIIFDIRPLMGGKHSGVEIYTRFLLKHLLKIDKNNRYVLYANSGSDLSDRLPRHDQPNVRTVVTRIPNKIMNTALFLFKKPLIDKLVTNSFADFRPALYFTPDLRPVGLRPGIKKICTVHDLSYIHFPRNFSLKTRIWHKLLDAKKTLKDFDLILAVSAFTANDLAETLGMDARKVKVTREGIEDSFCRGLDQSESLRIKKKYGLPENYLLFLSTLEPRKNIARLTEAFSIYKKKNRGDVKLVMVGTTNSDIFSSLRLKTHPDIVFTGFVAEEEKPHIFTMARAFIYPSLYEGFGLPLLEAMKCGTPIITSTTSSMPEICADAAIYANPRDAHDIASAIEKIFSPKTAELLKDRMSARVKTFSWETCARQTLDLFESI